MTHRSHGEEIAAALAKHKAGEVQRLEPVGHDDPLGDLFRSTKPKPGCPGVRVDAAGREWYSAAWLPDTQPDDSQRAFPARRRRVL